MNFYPIFTLIPYFCRTFVLLSENHKFEVRQLHQTSLKSLKLKQILKNINFQKHQNFEENEVEQLHFPQNFGVFEN